MKKFLDWIYWTVLIGLFPALIHFLVLYLKNITFEENIKYFYFDLIIFNILINISNINQLHNNKMKSEYAKPLMFFASMSFFCLFSILYGLTIYDLKNTIDKIIPLIQHGTFFSFYIGFMIHVIINRSLMREKFLIFYEKKIKKR